MWQLPWFQGLPITDDDRLVRAEDQFVDVLNRDVVVHHIVAAPPSLVVTLSIEQNQVNCKG